MREPIQTIKGAIFGQAIGDALGHPYEFGTKNCRATDVPERFTDDTQMMREIAEAMLAAPPHLSDAKWEPFMTTLGKRFVMFRDTPFGGGHRSPGGACMSGCAALAHNDHWSESGGTSQKGNGAAMRSSVVGAAYWKNPRYAFQVGCMTAIPTHNNLEAILTAGIVSYLVAESINGTPFGKSVHRALTLASNFDNTVPVWPREVKLGRAYAEQDPAYVVAHIGKAFIAAKAGATPAEFKASNGVDFATVPAVAAAVFYNARHNNFTDTVVECINNTSDCDTTGGIAGAIAGARYGYSFIKRDWTARVEQTQYWHNLSDGIYQLSCNYKPMVDTVGEPSRT